MKFVKCEKEFVEKRTKKNLKVYFKEFMCSNLEAAKVELKDWEYSNIWVACTTFKQSIKRYGFPIEAHVINGELYIERTDI